MRHITGRIPISLITIFFFLWTGGLVGPVLAGVVGPHSDRNVKPDKIRVWERTLVFQWLKDYGYSADRARLMSAKLTDKEVHDLILQAENMGLPYGTGAIEAIVAILIVLILIIIILRLLNKEIIIS